jgi:hypothetical protein
MINLDECGAMADECIRPAQTASTRKETPHSLPPAPTLAAVLGVGTPEELAPSTARDLSLLEERTDIIANFLNAIPEGSAIAFSAGDLGVLLSADGPILPAREAWARAEHLASACDCFFCLEEKAGMGTFTKGKPVPETVILRGRANPIDAREAIAKSAQLLPNALNPFRSRGLAGAAHSVGPPIAATMAHTVQVSLVSMALGGVGGAALVWTLAGQEHHEMNTPRQSLADFTAYRLPATIPSADQAPESDTIGHDRPPAPQAITTSPARADMAPLRVTDPRVTASSLKETAPGLVAPNSRSLNVENGGADKFSDASRRLAARSRPNSPEHPSEPFFRPWWYSR